MTAIFHGLYISINVFKERNPPLCSMPDCRWNNKYGVNFFFELHSHLFDSIGSPGNILTPVLQLSLTTLILLPNLTKREVGSAGRGAEGRKGR